MRGLFWASAGLIAYTYAGYALWLWCKARLWPCSIARAGCEPAISIVMVVRNEQEAVGEKLRNLRSLDYPQDHCQIVVISDGSADGTDAILKDHAGDPRMIVLRKQFSQGKASGLNDALAAATGEIVVFVDARQQIEPGALRAMVENFADPSIGCVSGELMIGDPALGESGQGMGLYWKIEKKIREWESASGSVVGATGALYAVRRELVGRIPEGTILDDLYVPMRVVKQGCRVVLDGRARAWDRADLGAGREFSRKVRTLSGNYQLVQMEPWLIWPGNPIWFSFISHKLLRLVVPLALVMLLISSAVLHGVLYRTVLWLQIALYGLSTLAWAGWLKAGPLGRAADAARTFVVLNAAALIALTAFVTGRKIAWTR